MQIKNNHDKMKPVMRLIEKYAPNTYEAMLNAYWPVTLVIDGSDFDDITGKIPAEEVFSLSDTLASGLGVTCRPNPNRWSDAAVALDWTSWLNFHGINMQAGEMGVDAAKLAATVLVHEWTHRRGYGEPEAYAEGAKFARAMGEERIARSQESTGLRVAREERRAPRRLVVFA